MFLNIEQKTFGWLSKKISGAFKLLSTSPWELFEKKVFQKFLQLLWTFFGSFPVIEQEKLGRSLKTAFSVSIKSFWEKKLFWKTNEIYHHFQTLSKMFSASCRVFRRGKGNCILSVQGNILTKNGSISKFFSFLDTEQYFWPILEKKVAEKSKLDSQFQWKLPGENLLENLQNVNFWKTTGKSAAVCRKKISGAFKLLSTSP